MAKVSLVKNSFEIQDFEIYEVLIFCGTPLDKVFLVSYSLKFRTLVWQQTDK